MFAELTNESLRKYQPQFKSETTNGQTWREAVRWPGISQLYRYAEELKQPARENKEPTV